MPVGLKSCCLAGLVLAAVATAAAAQEPQAAPAPQVQMKPPRISAVAVDWASVRAALATVPPLGATNHKLARLNEATRSVFADIANSAVPVLLPFDTASFLADKAAGAAADNSKYLQGYSAASLFFDAGPEGYDASLTVQPAGRTDASLRRRIDVQISGSAVIYELDGPALPEGSPVPELENLFPGIRRQTLEDHLRYTFVRFGVPYLVTVMCQRMRCREADADRIGIAFLKSLAIVGGAPQPAADPQAAEAEQTPAPPIEQPKAVSPDFTYYPPGDILPGTGMRGQNGDADSTVYADIRFPMAEAPAYVNSQTFMNWGDCDFTGRVALGGSGKEATYRCRVNSIPLVRDESKNYAYPWRDNFCEHRYFAISQCPAGLGHQGEDIRPGSCELRNREADRCQPYFADIVAVRDGMVMRGPGDEALYLVVDAPGEHIRFRYLHMNPNLLDTAGMVNGRALREGQLIGTADDYEGHQGGTTYHLHFDMQVPTRAGWVFVNPYMTLVAAYQRLIGARGKVVTDAVVAATPASSGLGAVAAQARNQALAEAGQETVEHRANTAERRCELLRSKGHRRRRCRTGVAERHERGERAHAVRAASHRVSRHEHGELRHAHRSSRHGRA